MPIPDTITKEHVLEAMSRLGLYQSRWPPNSQSTDYDVVDPRTQAKFPPKLVLSTAAELATGEKLPRSTFSGGQETNGRLKRLGFDVVLKSSKKPL